MDAEYGRGQRLFVETKFGNLEGVFYSKNAGQNRLTLTEVVLQASGEKMEGFRHYYKNEVISGKFCMSTYTRVKFLFFLWQLC
jgi:hypothetical protein